MTAAHIGRGWDRAGYGRRSSHGLGISEGGRGALPSARPIAPTLGRVTATLPGYCRRRSACAPVRFALPVKRRLAALAPSSFRRFPQRRPTQPPCTEFSVHSLAPLRPRLLISCGLSALEVR